MATIDFAIGIGGEAGQGIATPGDILARIFARRGLHLNAYNAYQSIIRGGHTFLTIRASDAPVTNMGDKLDVLIPLNQDAMNRHLRLLRSGACVIFDAEKLEPGEHAQGVQLCPMPMKQLCGANKLGGNTVAIAATLQMIGIEFEPLEQVLTRQFKKKGDAVIAENVSMARAGYDYAATNFKPFPVKAPKGQKPLAVVTGNQTIALGGAAAGVKFYAAYPMSPSTGVLMWMAAHARQLGIMVRQVEDEIGVMNMVIGAAHAGCRAMCATSGGGFALMSEAIGMSGMIETPVVCVDVQRAGPATGVPTKTEQGDLWQIPLLRFRRHTCSRTRALHVDTDNRRLDHPRHADGFTHQRKSAARSRAHGPAPRVRRADHHVHHSDLILDLPHHDAQLPRVRRHPHEHPGGWAHGISGIKLHARRRAAQRDRLIPSNHGQTFSALRCFDRERLEICRGVIIARSRHIDVLGNDRVALLLELSRQHLLQRLEFDP